MQHSESRRGTYRRAKDLYRKSIEEVKEIPDENGYELIRKIRALGPEQGGDVPAVALTAYAGHKDRRRALLSGFHTHLAKPVEPDEL
jgi:CheY-like chemotaxis protein